MITLLFILLGGLLITSLSARRNQLWNLTRLLPSIKM
ncbi:Uncharacterised protein [Mycobacteroides abscessus subsp. abscessus]|nr:Uncharacterised protein [Mycobacteroides abscessus subsp. abscessus]